MTHETEHVPGRIARMWRRPFTAALLAASLLLLGLLLLGNASQAESCGGSHHWHEDTQTCHAHCRNTMNAHNMDHGHDCSPQTNTNHANNQQQGQPTATPTATPTTPQSITIIVEREPEFRPAPTATRVYAESNENLPTPVPTMMREDGAVCGGWGTGLDICISSPTPDPNRTKPTPQPDLFNPCGKNGRQRGVEWSSEKKPGYTKAVRKAGPGSSNVDSNGNERGWIKVKCG